MKFKSSVLAALVFVSVAASAGTIDGPVMSVVAGTTNGVYNVQYITNEISTVKLSIFDAQEKLVFTETIGKVGSFIRPYNFSALPYGEYTVVLQDKNSKQVERVNYTVSRVESIVKISKLANAENKFLVAVANPGSDYVIVRIFNGAKMIFEKTHTINGDMAVVYNLEQIKGDLSFEVTTSTGKQEIINY